MKALSEIRNILKLRPLEINSSLEYLANCDNIDYDVFLPSRNINLQRDFVWTLEQKRELIWSVLIGRYIPRLSLLNIHFESDSESTYQVIDGKQRLSTLIDFYKNKFTIDIDGQEYKFDDLTDEYKKCISGYMIPYYIVSDGYGTKISDDDKIEWFMFINYAGTKQDKEFMEYLKR